MTTFHIFLHALVCLQLNIGATLAFSKPVFSSLDVPDSMEPGLNAIHSGKLEEAVFHFSAPLPSNRYAAIQQYYLGQSLFYSRRYVEAANIFAKALVSLPPSWLRTRLLTRYAESLVASRRFSLALPALQAAINEKASPELIFQLAQTFQNLNQSFEAKKLRTKLVVRHPTHPYAMQLQTQNRLELEPLEILQLAQNLLTEGHAQRALKILELLPDLRSHEFQTRELMLRIKILFALNDTDAVDSIWSNVEQLPGARAAEAKLAKAKYLMRIDKNSLAIKALKEMPGEDSEQSNLVEAKFLEGWLLLQTDRFNECEETFKAFAKSFPKTNRTSEARWYRSLCLISLNRMSEAYVELTNLARVAPKGQSRSQALYWSARAAESMYPSRDDERREYIAQYRVLALDNNHGFYSLLAKLRLKQLGSSIPKPLVRSVSSANLWTDSFRFAESLAKLGLRIEADAAFIEAMREIKTTSEAKQVATLCNSKGLYAQALELADQSNEPSGYSRNSFVLPNTSYPRAYIEELGGMTEHSRSFFWSIMRRESRFRPGAKSFANARGLMQLITPTARQIAGHMNLETIDETDLYTPKINISLARWYIEELTKKFSHPALVAAAYNAGPMPVEKWLKERGHLPLDYFAELIPFKETRNYVKAVLADYDVYSRLYSELPPLEIDFELPKSFNEGVRF